MSTAEAPGGDDQADTKRDDKDLPLREDIRLLGRILGDTVREQRGAVVFDTVERIRQASIAFAATRTAPRARNSGRR